MTDHFNESTLRIELDGDCSFAKLEPLLRQIDPLAKLRTKAFLHLDLEALGSASAAAFAWIFAALDHVHFVRLVESSLVIGVEQRSDDPHIAWVETPIALGFSSYRDLRLIVPRVVDHVAERVPAEGQSRGSLRICLDELCENVVCHSGAMTGGQLVARVFSDTNTMEIAVADLGVGITSSLVENPRFADLPDDLSAAASALQPRVTSDPERNGGFGLAVACELVENHGGRLLLRSGNAAVSVGRRREVRATALHLPGTLVALQLPADQELSIEAVYDRMHDQFEASLRDRGLHDEPLARLALATVPTSMRLTS